MNLSSDVVVLGAGAAGLAAGSQLIRAGLRVIVVEARERIGGRVVTVHDPVTGVPLELGAEFVHGKPKSLLSLARRARLSVRPCQDSHAVAREGRLRKGDDSFDFLETLAKATPPDRPMADWVREQARDARWSKLQVALARSYVEGFYAADPEIASTLAIARMEKAAQALGGTTPSRVMEGYDRVMHALAGPLLERPGTVLLSAIAEEVRWGQGRVTVRLRSRMGAPLGQVRARRVIVTLPVGVLRAVPPARGAVRFVPALPDKARAWRRLEMGPLVKVLLRFRTPFWQGRGGTSKHDFFHAPGAAIPTWWTLSPNTASRHLVGWCGGPGAEMLSESGADAVLAKSLEVLARLFKKPKQALLEQLEDWHVHDWQREPFTRGGYAVIPSGAMDAMERLAAPVEGTVFFAGEATNLEGEEGTVHGALATGERAAREVLAHFRQRS